LQTSAPPQQITDTALSLNVADPVASARFTNDHLGFTEQMAADGFVAVTRPDAGFTITFLRTGLETFKPKSAAGPADGLLVAFVVDDVDAECRRLRAEGVAIVTEPETEPWGERYFQIADPNGVIFQFVQWVGEPPTAG
jgi:catechol 2,3-dioxygenase-like lactoylglutathione lyase family enzyme